MMTICKIQTRQTGSKALIKPVRRSNSPKLQQEVMGVRSENEVGKTIR